MECKLHKIAEKEFTMEGINRYIMECKSKSELDKVCEELRINRYIMECKFDSSGFIPEGKGELIDTLWNVNETEGYA